MQLERRTGYRVTEARYPRDLPAVQVMFAAYRKWLVEHREVTAFPDSILKTGLKLFDREVAQLPQPYVPPGGAFFLAWAGRDVVGSAALHPLAPVTGEIKRVFVRDGCRGFGLGGRLVRAVVRRARRIGYRRVVLDTLPTMTEAIDMYRSLGFRSTDRYWAHPVPDALFFEYRFDQRGGRASPMLRSGDAGGRASNRTRTS